MTLTDATLRNNYFIVSHTPGTLFCQHEWSTAMRQGPANRGVVDRECAACGRTERWLQSARPRSRR